MRQVLLNRVRNLFILTAPLAVTLTIGSLFLTFWWRRWEFLVPALLTPYLLPLSLFRIMNWIEPQKEGATRMIPGIYHPWAVALSIQYIYGALPMLEELLRVFPGAYSAWLRLWGSKIGKRVFFSPGFTLIDRAHLVVGDDAVVGFGVVICPHLAKQRDSHRVLYLKTVKIGKSAFIGGRSFLGPGSWISPGHFLPGFANMTVNMKDQYLLPQPNLLPVMPLNSKMPAERKRWLQLAKNFEAVDSVSFR